MRFLQWALPRLHMRWPGFRKVRKQVCKRIDRRIRELGLNDVESYRLLLEKHAEEWAQLDALCRITISRFYRDRALFDILSKQVLPTLANAALQRGEHVLRAWSAGCCSGEEPYSLALTWYFELQPCFPEMEIEIVATDADAHLLQRARNGRYDFGSLRELPDDWRELAFTRDDDAYCLEPQYRRGVRFHQEDIRKEQPKGRFDLVLCRNLVFTYFDEDRQREILKRILGAMNNGAVLVLGAHERLPEDACGLTAWYEKRAIYRKFNAA